MRRSSLPFWKKKSDYTLTAGLGNPGEHYSGNRHNIGFMCLNYFAKKNAINFNKKRCMARTGTGMVDGKNVVLAKPQTYMNLSGESVIRLVQSFKVHIDNVIVIHDDLDLPVGKIRIRRGGGSGGHKGINSIIKHLDNKDFIRVRIGIGRPPALEDSSSNNDDSIIDYVLGNFPKEERAIIERSIPEVSEILNCLLTEGLTATMNRFN